MWIPIQEYKEEQNRNLANGHEVTWFIPGYEGRYALSSTGKAFRTKLRMLNHWPYFEYENIELKQSIDSGGYKTVGLYLNGKHKTARVSKLMADVFLENPENLPTVDHIDKIRTDDRLDNLRHAGYRTQNLNRSNAAKHSYVYRHREGWRVQITANGKQRNFGKYQTIEAACKRRDEVCREYGITEYRH